jgi:3-oxoacyl-(acyl-carrier-protein) synthase
MLWIYMHKDSVAILGIGAITPQGATLEALRASRAAADMPRETATIAPPTGMSVRDQRRQARLTRLALYAADRAAAQAGVQGRNAGIYMGLTHSTATFLKEFHDYLFDYGPEMASPNAFSNGVTNAPLGAVSLHHKLTQGGATLVGLETGGLDLLAHAAARVLDGTHDLCFAGATEEYSPIVESVYLRLGWYQGTLPPRLPCPWHEGLATGVRVSDASVVCVLAPKPVGPACCIYTPLDDPAESPQAPDLVISCAGGGPADSHELALLDRVLRRIGKPVPVLFSKALFGETFAVGPMLSLAMAWDILHGRHTYAPHPVHESLQPMVATSCDPATVRSVLLVAASREGAIAGGLVQQS